MVKFGTFTLPHVLRIRRKTENVLVEKPIPGQSMARRIRSGGRGYVLEVSGEVRCSDSSPRDHLDLIDFCDGAARTLNLEDGSSAFSALMSKLTLEREIQAPKIIFYSAVFEEQNNPS